MTEKLYNKIDKFCNETDWSKYPTYEHALEDFIKGIVAEETNELEKENAELKEEIKKWQGKYTYKCRIENYLETQLTKAKEIIENIIRVTWGEGWSYSLDWKVKAEQFLKDSEVEK